MNRHDIYSYFVSDFAGWDETFAGNLKFFGATLAKDFYPFKIGDHVDSISIMLIDCPPIVQIESNGVTREYKLDLVIVVTKVTLP